MAPGQSSQFSATAQLSNGSTRDITSEVTWTSSDGTVLSIAPGGQATALRPGESDVGYTFNGRDGGVRKVLILTLGTFQLAGRVLDGSAPVFGALVEVTGGSAEGRSALTDWYGGYKIIGVSEDAAIRVTKDAFQPATKIAAASSGTASRRSLDFGLVRLERRPDHSGTYELDVTATCQNTSTIPDSLRRRRYTATLSQDANAGVELRLAGADFEIKYFPHGTGEGNLIRGQASDGRVRLVIDDVEDWGWNPNLIEKLGNDSYLIIAGEVVLQATPSGLSGTLDGYFRITRNAYAPFSAAEACVSSAHAFTLSK